MALGTYVGTTELAPAGPISTNDYALINPPLGPIHYGGVAIGPEGLFAQVREYVCGVNLGGLVYSKLGGFDIGWQRLFSYIPNGIPSYLCFQSIPALAVSNTHVYFQARAAAFPLITAYGDPRSTHVMDYIMKVPLSRFTNNATGGFLPSERLPIYIASQQPLYVPGTTPSIHEVDPLTGKSLTGWGTVGAGPGEIFGHHSMSGMFFDKESGRLYITDKINCRVMEYDADGIYIRQFGALGSMSSQFSSPGHICAHGNHIFVCDTGNNRVQIFNLTTFDCIGIIGSSGTGNNQFNNPGGIAADSAYIYVHDRGNYNIVKRFNNDGVSYDFVDSFSAVRTNDLDQFAEQIAVTTTNIYVSTIANTGVSSGQTVVHSFENHIPNYAYLFFNPKLVVGRSEAVINLKPDLLVQENQIILPIKPDLYSYCWGHLNSVNKNLGHLFDIVNFRGGAQSTNMTLFPEFLMGVNELLQDIKPTLRIGINTVELEITNATLEVELLEVNTGQVILEVVGLTLIASTPIFGTGGGSIEMLTAGMSFINPVGTSEIAYITMECIGFAGSYGILSMPSVVISGFGFIVAKGTGSAEMTISATGSGIADMITSGSVIALTLALGTSTGFISPSGSGVASFMLRASGIAVAGTVGEGVLELVMETSGMAYFIGAGNATIPITLRALGVGSYASGTLTTLVPVMNVRNTAMTEFDLPLRDITTFKGQVYATDGTSVYEILVGMVDGTANIPTSFATSLSDSHLSNVRLVRELYTTVRTGGAMSVQVTTDEGRNDYTYQITPTIMNQMHGVRTKCGRGLKGRFLKFTVTSNYNYELDKMRLLVEPLSHRER